MTPLPLTRGSWHKLGRGAVEHVDIDVRHRPEATPLHHDRLLVQDLGRLEHLMVGPEHHGVGQAVLHEVQRHQAVVHFLESRAAELQHVDFDPVGPDVVDQGLDQLAQILAVVKCAVDQIASDDAEGFLLQDLLLVPHPDVEHDFARLAQGLGLEADAHPAVGLVRAFEILGRDRVGEDEEGRILAPQGLQPLDQQLVLVVEHGRKPLARDIARSLAVDRVAENHVVGRNRLGDRSRRPAGVEKEPGHLLAGPDLGKRAVFRPVQIDRERLAIGRKEVFLFSHKKANYAT